VKLLAAIALALVLLLALPSAGLADSGLEVAVSAASLPRAHSDALHAIAHRRVVEYVTDRSHAPPADTGEVLGWNRGLADPIGSIVVGWLTSGTQRTILLDPDYTVIGCAELVADDPLTAGIDQTHFFACLVGTPSWADAAPPAALPNTATEASS
jgi:hypothetical protein